MGIRSMLRKVFGRDREDTPATSAVPPQTRETPKSTTPDTPEAAARRAADDLVAASFDNPQIPRARAKTRAAGPEAATVTEGAAPAAEAEAAADAPKAEADATATAEPAPVDADADAAGAAVTVADTDAVDAAPEEQAEAEAAAQATAEAKPEAAPEAKAEEPAAVAADADATTADAEAAPQEQAVEPEAAAADAVDAAPQEQAKTEAAAQATAEAAPEAKAEEPAAVAADADATTADAEAAPQEQAVEPEAAAADAVDAAPQEQAKTEAAPQATADAEAEADEPAIATADAEAAPQERAVEPEAAAQAEVVTADADVTTVDAEAAPQEQAAATEAPVPALPLAKVKADAPHLVEAYKAAGAQLKKQGLAGARAAVYLVVDRSGSMRGYFKDGSVQRLAEQVTALAAHLDEDATVTTVFFSTDIDGTVDLTPADLTPTRVDEVNATLGRLGRTNYHRAVEEVLAHHEKADASRPALVVFQTDGAPESKTAATQALAEAGGRPLHWRFVAWGEEDSKAFDYLRKLDGTPRTGTYFAGATPVETAHPAFYRGLLAGLEF
ncbi:VWA domain-containing protein [Streptomyces venezuelae]|uniref:VWA domain-containing protein n=1 Tax=Streptomyces venezuelae TaxID=54571 RepID=UPI001CC242DB|nr:VWA domain-containing protein [Streptomyces venezuelae]